MAPSRSGRPGARSSTTAPCVIDGGTCREVVDQHVGDAEAIITLHDTVAREREDASGAAAPGIVIPESGPDTGRQAGLTDGSPAAATQIGPGLISSYLTEQAKDLGIAGGAVAPAVAVALDKVRPVGRIGVWDEEAVRAGPMADMSVIAPSRPGTRSGELTADRRYITGVR